MEPVNSRKTSNANFQVGRPLDFDQRAEMREVLERAILNARRGALPLKIPRVESQMQKHPGMHYHFKPELFLQMRGATDFETPHEKVYVKGGGTVYHAGRRPASGKGRAGSRR